MNIKQLAVIFFSLSVIFSPTSFAEMSQDELLLRQLEQSRTIKREQAKQVIWENMVFTAEEEKEFWPLYEAYRGEMRKLNDQLLELIKDYATYYNTSEMARGNGTKSFEKALDIESARIAVKREYIKKFKKILPEHKVARFFHVDNKIEILIKYGLSKEIPLSKVR